MAGPADRAAIFLQPQKDRQQSTPGLPVRLLPQGDNILPALASSFPSF